MTLKLPSTRIAAGGQQATTASTRSATAANPFSRNAKTLVYFVPFDGHSRALLKEIVPTLARWLPPDVSITAVSPVKGS